MFKRLLLIKDIFFQYNIPCQNMKTSHKVRLWTFLFSNKTLVQKNNYMSPHIYRIVQWVSQCCTVCFSLVSFDVWLYLNQVIMGWDIKTLCSYYSSKQLLTRPNSSTPIFPFQPRSCSGSACEPEPWFVGKELESHFLGSKWCLRTKTKRKFAVGKGIDCCMSYNTHCLSRKEFLYPE